MLFLYAFLFVYIFLLFLIFLTVYTFWNFYSATNSSGQMKHRENAHTFVAFCQIKLMYLYVFAYFLNTIFLFSNSVLLFELFCSIKSDYLVYNLFILPILGLFAHFFKDFLKLQIMPNWWFFTNGRFSEKLPILPNWSKIPNTVYTKRLLEKNRPQKDFDSICHSHAVLKISGRSENFFSLGVKGIYSKIISSNMHSAKRNIKLSSLDS
jgi:hypothetical protein